MSTPPPPPSDNSFVPPVRRSGVRTVLSYTGIPPSWLDKRPKLPSRNWLIFLSVTSSVVGLYAYDRRRCKQIRQEYVEKVKHLSEVPADPFEVLRKVTVYGSKWPADEDYDQSLRYFRKYVKPILIAAGVDYEMIPGKRHGEIMKRVAEDIRLRRRLDLEIDIDSDVRKALPTYRSPAVRRQNELEGGIVIIGRPTFKEFMAGLKKGWTSGLEKVDEDEELARILENDSHFDEPEDPRDFDMDEPSKKSPPLSAQTSPVFSPLQIRPSFAQNSQQSPSLPTDVPAVIPPLPPLLLVSFTDYIGISQIPLMIWDFFNQRHKVLAGAQAGYRLVMNISRPIEVPESLDQQAAPDGDIQEQNLGDLDFDKQAESYYKKSLKDLPKDIEEIRTKYYESLAGKLATARELARGTREPTKAELENPPPTEVELRAERLKKERRWRNDVDGWNIIKPSTSVTWDPRFKNALRVFVDPPQESTSP
ncbi:Mitochondrial import inner membrane translocase subunit TIM54 [Psilocybe cubensis]|uniref:Mitochondrial import inner membrane translocase subunit TIM54 n=2 Tax=Psilocybe cubensis TaxID=181762 RepID=A0ACB8H7S5_PSICU|nr:Mitochondrial import inner membrane translocase subunit TIM54 [Psilocybe cubensis]KAH9483966.1 Mitochondrial import inner membrane translocase subunit TIM54 [Psilocybe cubensis]